MKKKMGERLRDMLLSEDVMICGGMILLLIACVLLIAYGYYQPKWQAEAEQKEADERRAFFEQEKKLQVAHAVDAWVRARRNYDLLTEEERRHKLPPKGFEGWMAEARELSRREGYILGRFGHNDDASFRAGATAKDETYARLQAEPLATREEIDRRLKAFMETNGWFWITAEPGTMAMLLSIDIDEYRWLSTMVNRHNDQAEQEAKKKVAAHTGLAAPVLSVRFTGSYASGQCQYLVSYNTDDAIAQYRLLNDAIRDVVNAGPLGKAYVGGIWMPGDNVDGKAKERNRLWYTCYNLSQPLQGRREKQAMGYLYDVPSYQDYSNVLLGIQVNEQSIRIVINALAMSEEALRKLEPPLLALAQKAGVRASAGGWTKDGDGTWTMRLMK